MLSACQFNEVVTSIVCTKKKQFILIHGKTISNTTAISYVQKSTRAAFTSRQIKDTNFHQTTKDLIDNINATITTMHNDVIYALH